MSSKTKIVVLRMKEIIYTAIFIGLGILLVTLFFIMFRPKKEGTAQSLEQASYIPGVYTASLALGNQTVNVEVSVDADRINSVLFTPVSDSVTAMYPLVAPAAADLAAQICDTQSLEQLSFAEGSRYTSAALLSAVRAALEKAAVSTTP